MTSRRRQRTFAIWIAHLAVVALFFQVTAIDHWRPSPDDLVGVEGKSTHVLHCHGSQSGCVDAATALIGPVESSPAPLPPLPLLKTARSIGVSLLEAPPLTLLHPPQPA